MVKKKLYRTLIIAGITGSLLVSTGLVAFASSSKSNITPKAKIGVNGFMKKGGNSLVSVLKTQVTAGIITQAESDAITSFLTTKEAADKVTRTAEKAKLDAMTDAERKAYREANKPVKTDILAEVVTAGLLTQAQADEIQAAMPKGHEGGAKQSGKMGINSVDMFKTQVTARVITQAEADNAVAFIKTKEDARKAEMTAEKAKYNAMTDAQKAADKVTKKATKDAEKAKLDAMTSAEREAYMKANRPAHENIFADLVTAGILTQSEVDKIQASMPKRSDMGNRNGQRQVGAPTNDSSPTI